MHSYSSSFSDLRARQGGIIGTVSLRLLDFGDSKHPRSANPALQGECVCSFQAGLLTCLVLYSSNRGLKFPPAPPPPIDTPSHRKRRTDSLSSSLAGTDLGIDYDIEKALAMVTPKSPSTDSLTPADLKSIPIDSSSSEGSFDSHFNSPDHAFDSRRIITTRHETPESNFARSPPSRSILPARELVSPVRPLSPPAVYSVRISKPKSRN